MNQKGGAAIDAGFEEPDALLGSNPALDDDVIELFAKELVDDAFMGAADFKKISQGADRRDAFRRARRA